MTYRRRPLRRAKFSLSMHIPLDEALVLLNGWRNEGTPLSDQRLHWQPEPEPASLRLEPPVERILTKVAKCKEALDALH
jgi:hypothetical protein